MQTLGGIGPPDTEAYASALVRRLARALSASPILLPAPGVVATPAVRDALREDPHVNAALQQLDSLDMVFVGIGSLASNKVLNDGMSLPPGAYAELVAAGAVGDIALRFFDAKGGVATSSLEIVCSESASNSCVAHPVLSASLAGNRKLRRFSRLCAQICSMFS